MLTRPKVRRTLLTSRICLVLATLACSNLDNIIIKKSANSTIQGGSPLSLLNDLGLVEFGNINVSNDEDFKSKGFDIDDVDSIKVESLMLEITAPASGQDFTFIEHVSFYATPEGQPRTLIAQGGPFEAGLRTVGLDVEDVNLKPFLKDGSFSLGTEVQGHDPQNTTTIKATITLNVDVAVSHVLCGK